MNYSTQKLVLSLTASILAAGSAQAYEVSLSTNLPSIDFHGFASQGFLASDKYNYLGDSSRGSFNFSEAGVNATMNPFPHTRIMAQGFLFDVGKVGEYEPTLDYALIDYNFCNAFGIRAGRIIRPEGIYNASQSIDLARTSIILPQGMYDARYRDFNAAMDGGSLYGDISLGKGGSFSYETYAGIMNPADNGGVARRLEDSLRNPPTVYGGVSDFIEYGAQFWWNTPLDGLRAGVGVSDEYGFNYRYLVNIPPMYGGGTIKTISAIENPNEHFSLEYQWKSWTFQTEYKYSEFNVHNSMNGVGQTATSTAGDTWYIGAAYRANKWLEIGAYYSEDYADVNNRTGAGTATPSDAYQKDAALSFRFDIKPWWIVKVEGHAINGTAMIYDNGSNPSRNGDEWFMLAVKTTFSF